MAAVCRVLLVEDDPDDARMAVLGLQRETRFELVHVRTGADALDVLEQGGVQACLVDHRLPDTTGVELVRRIRAAGYKGPLIMVSGVREDHVVANALAAGADDFLVKDLEYGDELSDRLRAHVGV